MNKEYLEKFAKETNNELYDPEYKNGEWMVSAVETHETIEDFEESSKKWRECGNVKKGEIAGFKFAYWPKVQVNPGEKRRDVSIIDFGEIRIVLDNDITLFL